MNFTETISREQLQKLPAIRLERIKQVIESTAKDVVMRAWQGHTGMFVVHSDINEGVTPGALSCILSLVELIDGLKEKLPGCKVSIVKLSTEVTDGEQGEVKAILIDWS